MSRHKLSKEKRQAVYDKMGGHCAYCGCEIALKDMQVDHMTPVYFCETHGLDSGEVNALDNLLPACRSCNQYKGTLTVEKFRRLIERGSDILTRSSVAYRTAVRFGTVKPNPQKVVFYFERFGQNGGIEKQGIVDF